MKVLSETASNEDKVLCEQIPKNLTAGLLSPRHEPVVAWFQNSLRDNVGARG